MSPARARPRIAAALPLAGLALLALAPLALRAPRVLAQPDCPTASIRAPFAGQAISGTVPIYGSADVDAFRFYKLEWARAEEPETWIAVSEVIETPRRNALLDRWDTSALASEAPGAYRLKLTVVDQDSQERCRMTVEPLAVGVASAAAPVSGTLPASYPPARDAAAPASAEAAALERAAAEGTQTASAAESEAAAEATDAAERADAAAAVRAEAAATAAAAEAAEAAAAETATPALGQTPEAGDAAASPSADEGRAAEEDGGATADAGSAADAASEASAEPDPDAASEASAEADTDLDEADVGEAMERSGLGGALRGFALGFALVFAGFAALGALWWLVSSRR